MSLHVTIGSNYHLVVVVGGDTLPVGNFVQTNHLKKLFFVKVDFVCVHMFLSSFCQVDYR